MRKEYIPCYIIENDRNIFNGTYKFCIPLYQRAFAWEEKELRQLVEDIVDIDEHDDSPYYLGSLILHYNKEKQWYEVIDGQQRLTALYLLIHCLSKKYSQQFLTKPNALSFECRNKSNNALKDLDELVERILKGLNEKKSKNDFVKDDKDYEESIIRGCKTLLNLLSEVILNDNEVDENKISIESFVKKLSKVVLFKIDLPPHTDLNKYFEIMNTRGEQLEQHHILKAYLMQFLPEDKQAAFAKIWDACSDMTGYVQMHFSTKDRKKPSLFGDTWDGLAIDFPKYAEAYDDEDSKKENSSDNKKTLEEIIDTGFSVTQSEEYIDDDGEKIRVRFESIIDFPYFLLHTLKVFVNKKYEVDLNCEDCFIPKLLDDKKLVKVFEDAIKKLKDEQLVNEKDFSEGFIEYLLLTRCLFDKFIIKREFINNDENGKWCLKSLFQQDKDKDKPYYANTRFVISDDYKNNNTIISQNATIVDQIIMIQSAMRVSYTSPKSMHWITELLIWLLKEDDSKACNYKKDISEIYLKESEKIASDAVQEGFINKYSEINPMGTDTPHIVFNFLDYLLWKNEKNKYSGFVFEFRNSVEHWYPRNPSSDTFDAWNDKSGGGFDRFGNLCLVQSNINSRFSNLDPEAKAIDFVDTIEKGSIKLRIMKDNTVPGDDKRASYYWKDTACAEHEKEMLNILREACGLPQEL